MYRFFSTQYNSVKDLKDFLYSSLKFCLGDLSALLNNWNIVINMNLLREILSLKF